MTFDRPTPVLREPLQESPKEMILKRLADPKHYIEIEINNSPNTWIHAYGTVLASVHGLLVTWKYSNKYSGAEFEKTCEAAEQLLKDYNKWKSESAEGTIPISEDKKQEYLQRFEPIRQGMIEFLKK